MPHILFISDDWANKKALKSELLERGFRVSPIASEDCFRETFAPPRQLDAVLLVTEEHLGRIDFGWGIEDYLTLPVSAKRLAERLHFLVWKLHRVALKNGFSLGGLVIDFERYEVHVHGEPVDLTYKEFELLKFLAAHPGKVFTRDILLDRVWGYDFYGGTRTVDVHIRRLRAKLEAGPARYIETVRHVGYKFLGPPAP